MWILRAFLPRMIANDRGSIVSMSALAGYAGFPNMLPFVASKFAIRGVMEGLYLELR
jgi:all-trans-retinol dehydrogenase (NAD+)